MHEMQAIVIDVCGVCLSVCVSHGSALLHCAMRRAAFAKLLWPLVSY